MLALPPHTKLHKVIPKKTIFNKFNLKTLQRSKFDADIARITIIHELSPHTLPITQGKSIESIFIISLDLKKPDFLEKNILLLSKLIQHKILFLLKYKNQAKLALFHTRLLSTPWLLVENIQLNLQSPSLDHLWETLIQQVSPIEISPGLTLTEQLIFDKEKQLAEKKIHALSTQARKEKQPKKRLELFQKITFLKNKINGQAQNAQPE